MPPPAKGNSNFCACAMAAAFCKPSPTALILGVLLPLVGALLAINMIGALVTVHLKGGFWMPDSGYEYVLALAAGALAVGFANAGVLSVDHYLFNRVYRSRSVDGSGR